MAASRVDPTHHGFPCPVYSDLAAIAENRLGDALRTRFGLGRHAIGPFRRLGMQALQGPIVGNRGRATGAGAPCVACFLPRLEVTGPGGASSLPSRIQASSFSFDVV